MDRLHLCVPSREQRFPDVGLAFTQARTTQLFPQQTLRRARAAQGTSPLLAPPGTGCRLGYANGVQLDP